MRHFYFNYLKINYNIKITLIVNLMHLFFVKISNYESVLEYKDFATIM